MVRFRSAGVFVHPKRIAHLTRPVRVLVLGRAILDGRLRVPDKPNRYWASGITHIPAREGRIYLAVTMDLYSRRIVGSVVGSARSARLLFEALLAAVASRRPPHAFIHHVGISKIGIHKRYIALLERAGSRGPAGTKWESTVIKSFFATVSSELYYRGPFNTRDEARLAISQFLEDYNHKRIHTALKYRSPVEFETLGPR